MIRIVLIFSLLSPLTALAETSSSLPDPLSLQQAMQLASDNQHFQVLEAEAAIVDAQSQLSAAESALGFKAKIEIEAAYIEPSRFALNQSGNDSRVSLRLSKPLYDFGGSDDKILAASTEQLAAESHMAFILAQRKINIARQFFEVVLADLKYAWDNEAMAVAFVSFDADKDRYALTKLSEVDLLEAENSYLETLYQRNLSEVEQRHSRARLAEELNKPEQLPSDVLRPTFDFSQQNLPEYQLLVDKVLLNNPQIVLAEKRLQAANQRVIAEDKQMNPRLDAEFAVSDYARVTSSTEDWRAQLNLVIPLYENSSIKSDIAKARAVWLKQRAMLLNIKMDIRKQVLRLWQSINVLNKRREQLQTSLDFRELNLDKSRALYEMEVKTDLGTSMIAISEIQYKQAKNDYELVLAWMQLRLLAGETNVMKMSF